jgi:Ca2+-binding RTX toxin-like protein
MDQIGVPDVRAGANDPASYSPATYPFDDVVYIEAYFNPTFSLQGSGAIIGAHSILTASHLVWDQDLGLAASQILAIPAYPAFDAPVGGRYIIHYFQIDNAGDLISANQSQSDYAVIDYASDLSRFGAFGIDTSYAGGTVHMTGYPATANGFQTDQVGDVSKNIFFNLLDYVSVTPSPGNSGGPLWVDEGTPGNPQPYVVGVVSSSGHAALLTLADLQTIEGWQRADADQFARDATGNVLQAQTGQTDVEGSSGDDTVTGWGGGDYLRGNSGDDSIQGGAGFDDINGNKGDDTINGDQGVGSDWLVGGQNNDSITAHAGENLLYGNLGNDTLHGGNGGDVLRGGQGDDVIAGGSGADFVSGDRGNDTESGGAGADNFHTSEDAGIDRVLDFSLAEGDRVQLDPGTVYTLTQVGADTVINLAPGSQMVLVGVQMSSLTPGWIFGA